MDPPRHNGLNMHLLNLILNVDCAESIHRSALTGWVLVLTLVGLSLRKTDDGKIVMMCRVNHIRDCQS